MYAEQDARRSTTNPNLPVLVAMVLSQLQERMSLSWLPASRKNKVGPIWRAKVSPTRRQDWPLYRQLQRLSSFNGISSTSFLVACLVID